MIFSDSAIVLFRQDFRENDRIVSFYTQQHGRLNARVPGVSRPLGKMKAFTELFTSAEVRIYVKRGGVMGTVTGGKIQTIYPAVRRDLKRMQQALYCCELVRCLTPLHQPSPEKFELLSASLAALDKYPVSSAFAPAFTLRLMTLAGFGLDRPVLKISSQFWQKMHEAPFEELNFSAPEELLFLSKCNSVCRRFLDSYLTRPLNTVKNIGLPEWETEWNAVPEEVVYPEAVSPVLQPVH
jgi:DNA repair protein RecO (recombination protein O)